MGPNTDPEFNIYDNSATLPGEVRCAAVPRASFALPDGYDCTQIQDDATHVILVGYGGVCGTTLPLEITECTTTTTSSTSSTTSTTSTTTSTSSTTTTTTTAAPTTTTTTTCMVGLTPFISTNTYEGSIPDICFLEFPTYVIYYHDGGSAYPVTGDNVYTTECGELLIVIETAFFGYSADGTGYPDRYYRLDNGFDAVQADGTCGA